MRNLIAVVQMAALLATVFILGCTRSTSSFSETTTGTTTGTTSGGSPALRSIAITPVFPVIVSGNTQQFTATGTYSDNSTGNVTASATWGSTNTAAATIAASSGLAKGVSIGATQVTATLGTVVSPATTLAVLNPTDVVTHHYNNARSGVQANETVLTTANVNFSKFGKVGEFTLDGQVDGQALYLSSVAIPGQGTKNVLYVATENDSVYALDADSISGSTATVLWKSSVALSGETSVPLSQFPCGNIDPNGVLATPVIDRVRNAIYVVSVSQDGSRNIYQRMHALDFTTGKELFGGPTTITATASGNGGNTINGMVVFDPTVQHDRAALLESGGTIYTAWSGLDGDCGPYSSWVISYNANTLLQTSSINLAPNYTGGGSWMGGGGPATDASGDVYVITGNTFSEIPGSGTYGNSFVHLLGSGTLSVVDFFSPYNTVSEDNADLDFGSTSPVILSDMVDAGGTTRHLAVGAGKDGNLYVVDRSNMGQFNSSKNSNYQVIGVSPGTLITSPAIYFNGTVYVCPVGRQVMAYSVSQALVATSASSQTAHQFGGNGAMASISANGTSNAILWGMDRSTGTLYAYDATNLTTEIYDSNQASGNRDHFNTIGGHFVTPMVTNGRVYLGTQNSLVVFGLLP